MDRPTANEITERSEEISTRLHGLPIDLATVGALAHTLSLYALALEVSPLCLTNVLLCAYQENLAEELD